jgi:hypothetical protein
MFSILEIEFLIDFEIGYLLKLRTSDGGILNPANTWTWVATRSLAFEVTEGTPTGTAGETTALNFKTAYDLDQPTGYTTIVTSNVIEITSTTTGEDFVSIQCEDNLGNRLVEGVDFNVTFSNYVAPIDISTVDFALTRSPHYINTPFIYETTTKATFNLYIWSGDLTSVPASPTYTLTKVRPTTDYSEFNTDISKILGELLDGKPTIDLALTSQIVDSTNPELKWLKYIVSFTDPVEAIADIEGTLIASEGFGYFEEGINPTKPSNGILTSCDYRKVSRDGFILLPFANVGNITSIDIQSENLQINESETITSGNNSNTAVQYLEVDVSQATTDEFITVTFQPDGDIITYEIVDECRYEPKQIIFKNKYGFYEVLTFFKKSTNTIEITNEDFVNAYVSNGTYSTTDHQKQKINIQGIESLTLNSGYIKETENSIYREMMLSDKVYLYGNSVLTPLNIKSSSLEFKNRVNDKLVKYTIEFEYAYNLIQNI